MNWLVHIAAHAIIHVAWVLAPYVAYGQVCQITNADGAKGTAVCIGTRNDDGTGVFFTAGHCVEGGGVWLAPEGRWLKAEPWAYWAGGPGKDFALVYCPGYKPKALYDLGSKSPAVGDEVTVCGFAHAGQLTVQRTRIRGYGKGYLNLECRGVQGVSGGPILVGKTVVGILTHDDYGDQCGIATNIETIHGALKTWRAAPSQTAWGFGVGMGGSSCGPYGCRPFVPMYPAAPVVPVQPYYTAPQQPYVPPQPSAPQQPGYPGFSTNPQPTQPTTPADPFDDSELRKLLSEMRSDVARIDLAVSAIRATGGKQGPPGEPGRDGRDADTARLDKLESDMAAVKASKITVRIVDDQGKIVSEESYPQGQPIEFRFKGPAK